ncbi:hypothetical protein [Aurantiacibacter flavus]|uniref:Autotransporter domain-containing protein n=1 Tax=Aurantiacibacter flavus TaxID=3145232 RepID=A0ABV0D0P4_9SPHN
MTTSAEERARGRPVFAMLGVLVVWVLLRLVFWQSPLMLANSQATFGSGTAIEAALARPSVSGGIAGAESAERLARLEAGFHPLVRIELSGLKTGGVDQRAADERADSIGLEIEPRPRSRLITAPSQPGESRHRDRGQSSVASAATIDDPVFAPMSVAPSRWMASTWVFWRDDSGGGVQAATAPNYGRSQAGAVLAYLLAPGSAHRPQVYSRATTALDGAREADLAAGLSARPLPDLPVRLAAEARLSLRNGANEVRPAVFAVTELPPLSLPGQFAGEVYAQAGWVGGDFATGFVDAQMRFTRALAQSPSFSLSAGGGAWAGAQKGTRRFDIGPSLSASFRLGDNVYGRLSTDYRVRVAGNAAPASGPALTLSAGF